MTLRFTVNHTRYDIEEAQFGWVWMSGRNESELVFATACEAQQDAIDTEQRLERLQQEAIKEAFMDARYGTYEQQHTLYGEGY